jgi:hypothetical protein
VEFEGASDQDYFLYVNEVEVASVLGVAGAYPVTGTAFYLGRPLAGTFSYSHFAMASRSMSSLSPMYALARPNAGTLTQDDFVDYLTAWTRQTITSLAADRTVVPFASEGLSALEAVQRTANNEAGIFVVDDSTGTVEILAAADCYTANVNLTIDVEDDATDQVDFARQNVGVVRYVTASNGANEVTVVDVDATVDATAGIDATTADLTELEGIASRRIAAGKYQSLRPARVVLDLTTATTDRYSGAMSLFPSARVRLTANGKITGLMQGD